MSNVPAPSPPDLEVPIAPSPFPTTWVGMLHFILTTRQGFVGAASLLVIAAIGAASAIGIMKPDRIEVATQAGTLVFKNGSRQDAMVLVTPCGGENDPWIDTGIFVKKGDKIKFSASGRIHTSLKRLVNSAQEDAMLEIPWTGPDGVEDEKGKIKTFRSKFRLLPGPDEKQPYPAGLLIGGTRDNNARNVIKPYWRIGSGNNLQGQPQEFIAESSGQLVLTVNDIWLKDMPMDSYVEPLDANDPDGTLRPTEKAKYNWEYWQNKAEEALAKRGNKMPTSEELKKEAISLYQARIDKWKEVRDKNPLIWYKDNTGAFSVSITVNG
jgi:hypothetical protein